MTERSPTLKQGQNRTPREGRARRSAKKNPKRREWNKWNVKKRRLVYATPKAV